MSNAYRFQLEIFKGCDKTVDGEITSNYILNKYFVSVWLHLSEVILQGQ
jgi:hypothetical protein